jgi:hypothetical protein
MADSGIKYPGTGANDSSYGTVAWGSPTNIQVGTDSDRALFDPFASGVKTSQYLKATNFDFSAIPGGATIDGIEVKVRRYCNTSSTCLDGRARIVKTGTIGSTDKSNGSHWISIGLETITYGGASDLWGETWSLSDIQNSTSGFALSATLSNGFSFAAVYWIGITVYYTEGGGSQGAALHHYRQQGMMRHTQPQLILPDRELITELPQRRLIENRLAT